MNSKLSSSILFLIIGLGALFSPMTNGDTMGPDQLDQDLLGVVIIDDLHSNDYTDTDTQIVLTELESFGYITHLASDYNTWQEAVGVANYLIIPAAFDEITTTEINVVVDWFDQNPANLLMSSRGDFSQPSFNSMNNLLEALGTDMRIQDDNVYTTDPSAYREWYIDTNNYNTASYPDIFSGVGTVNFFSPSSVSYSGSSEPLIFAEDQAYQSDEAGNPPAIIYDNTDDGTGGDVIPLAVIDELDRGDLSDRIITLGTTMWSDFDYGDTFADDISLVNNIMSYFTSQTLLVAGSIPINIEDTDSPKVSITAPHAGAFLKGNVDIKIDAFDLFGIDSYEIEIANEIVGNGDTFTWDTTQYPDGIYQVKVTVADEAGNTASTVNTYNVVQDYVPSAAANPKIMTYNIKQSGVYDAWFDVMVEENADIVILVETGNFDDNDNALLNSVMNDLNEIFFDELPYDGYTLQNIANDFNGITLLSRYPILSGEKLTSLQDDVGNNIAIPLPFLHSVVDVAGEETHIIGGHLSCCPGQSNWNQREQQQESVLNFMDDLGDVPIIYMGDMNAVSPDDVDPESQNVDTDLGTDPIEMVIDANHPKASEVHNFVDVAEELNAKSDTFIGSILSRIDYIFVNSHFSDLLISSTTGDTNSASIGSDHVSVDVVLDWSDSIVEPIYDLTTVSTISDDMSTTSSSSQSTNKNESTSNPSIPILLFPGLVAIAIVATINGKHRKRLLI